LDLPKLQAQQKSVLADDIVCSTYGMQSAFYTQASFTQMPSSMYSVPAFIKSTWTW